MVVQAVARHPGRRARPVARRPVPLGLEGARAAPVDGDPGRPRRLLRHACCSSSRASVLITQWAVAAPVVVCEARSAPRGARSQPPARPRPRLAGLQRADRDAAAGRARRRGARGRGDAISSSDVAFAVANLIAGDAHRADLRAGLGGALPGAAEAQGRAAAACRHGQLHRRTLTATARDVPSPAHAIR